MGSSPGTRIAIALVLIFGSVFCLASSDSSSLPDEYSIVRENELEGIVSEERAIELFRRWKEKHGKVYANSVEAEKRLENFKRNLKYVLGKNARNGDRKGHSVGLNRFADLSNEEFRQIYLSKVKKPASKWRARQGRAAEQRRRQRRQERLGSCDNAPSSLDWRNYGIVTGVKDQGSCGTFFSTRILSLTLTLPSSQCTCARVHVEYLRALNLIYIDVNMISDSNIRKKIHNFKNCVLLDHSNLNMNSFRPV